MLNTKDLIIDGSDVRFKRLTRVPEEKRGLCDNEDRDEKKKAKNKGKQRLKKLRTVAFKRGLRSLLKEESPLDRNSGTTFLCIPSRLC